MLKDALTRPNPSTLQGNPKKTSSSLTTFFEHSPSAFAVYNRKKQELTSWNDAFMNLWQCEAFILRETFPNPGLLRIQEKDFLDTWQHQMDLLDNRSQTTFECTLLTCYGEERTLQMELWKMSSPDNGLFGMKVDDITSTKKLVQESKKYIRII